MTRFAIYSPSCHRWLDSDSCFSATNIINAMWFDSITEASEFAIRENIVAYEIRKVSRPV